MGKKPVLGLVGFCLGLALSGCKDCNCGGGHASRKDEQIPVARQDKSAGVKKTETADANSVQDRQRSVPNTAPIASGRRGTYDFSPDSYDAPAPAGNGANVKTTAQTPKPVSATGVGMEPGPVTQTHSLRPSQPMAGEVVPAGRPAPVVDAIPPMRDAVAPMPIPKQDAAAAGLTTDSPDMIQVTGESSKKPTPTPMKEMNPVVSPVAVPHVPGALPAAIEPPPAPYKSGPIPAAPDVGPMPPSAPADMLPPLPMNGAKKIGASVDGGSPPMIDLPEPPPLRSADMKPAVAPAPAIKPATVHEIKTAPPTAVVDPVPTPPAVDGKGPEVVVPAQPPTVDVSPMPTPPGAR